MIQTHQIPDGVMLVVEPFSSPSKNAACRVIGEVKSTRPGQREVHFRLCDLNNLMTLSDLVTLQNSLRSLLDETRKQMDAIQAANKKPAKGRRKSSKQ